MSSEGQRPGEIPGSNSMNPAVRTAGNPGRRLLLHLAAETPAAIFALLPSAACPACLGAYGALLSAAGLGFLANKRVLIPATVALIAIGLSSLAWSARRHRRIAPLFLAGAGSAAILIGQQGAFGHHRHILTWAGASLFLAASVWNLTLKMRTQQNLNPHRAE